MSVVLAGRFRGAACRPPITCGPRFGHRLQAARPANLSALVDHEYVKCIWADWVIGGRWFASFARALREGNDLDATEALRLLW
jgi:hypothetical protein